MEFAAYWGLARLLKSPSNPQNCRKNEKLGTSRDRKINANFFWTKVFRAPFGSWTSASWKSAPKSVFFSCSPGGGEKLFDPRASGPKGQECPQEIPFQKFMFMLFSLLLTRALLFSAPNSGMYQRTLLYYKSHGT